ncbi:MAG TPA: hypothetical protein VIJ68_02835 [Candidatus Saccharimonadales bacterium]
MDELVNTLQKQFPALRFSSGRRFCWSPETGEIVYKAKARGQAATWSLLHETGHALLDHRGYKGDFELLKLEIDAWQRARLLASTFDLTIDEDHIEDCLDTYRDWLYKRSICPACGAKSLQQGDFVHYRCFNCHTTWRVTASRFCRAYRSTKNVRQATALPL